VDTTAPILIAPPTVVASADPGQCGATNVALGTANASDNCQLALLTNNAPPFFPVGTNLVTWTANDTDGNSTNATQLVIVNDTQLPGITCPQPITVPPDSGQSYASSVNLGTPVTSDNCGIAGVTNDAPAQFPIGTNLVTWIVFDTHGNSNNCVQQVIVSSPPQLPHRVTGITNNGDGTFTITFLGTAGLDYVVQISTNLVDWRSVQTNKALEDGSWSYTDHDAGTAPSRFYRAMRQ
jgi:hypothetical protein